MQPQRRLSLPAPARTTRMNGGPRLRMATPLPPFRASLAHGAAVKVARSDDVGVSRSDDRTQRGLPYVPPAIVEESPTFPVDAFIIPEGAARLPTGVGETTVWTATAEEGDPGTRADAGAAAPDVSTAVAAPELVDTAPLSVRPEPARRTRSATLREQRAHDVADRLEALATQLRQHGYEVLAQKSVRGDALDALLAGVIAGYLVAAE